MLDQETLTKRLKTIWGAHHFLFISKDVADIADLIKLPRKKVEELMRTPYWDEALFYWGHTPKVGDLKLAQQLWTELVERGEHIQPVEYADIPHKSQALQGKGDPAVYPLIQSHLFCVDNLSKREIRERLAEDGNPARYEGQQIRGYHWFVYPNKPLYSKVFAKVNIAGDLVIDYDYDKTALVCIRHGRLSLTRTVSDDIANISDNRLLVCL